MLDESTTGKGTDTMLVVSDKASEEIQKVLTSTKAQGNNLIIYFQGMG